ncbi:MAG: transglutaminaseTgpA domain-containing protein, partial [Chloroflexota bacterium]
MTTKTNELIQAKSVVFLTAALVMTATWAVGATGWVKGMNIVTFIGLGVILIGLMLARSILPGGIAHLFSLVIGLGWSFWVTGKLLPAHYTWPERWQNLVFRLNYWYGQAVQGGTSYDNLMFILQMNIIVWTMGYLTLWFVFRSGRVWQAVIPGGLVLLINLYYAPKDINFWFVVYLLLSLLLIIRFNLLNQEHRWRAAGVLFRPDISFDFLRDGFVFSLLVVGLAWLAPPVVEGKTLNMFDEAQGRWRDLQTEWNRLYADLNYRSTQTVGVFGQSLTLGGPRRLTDEPVMDVTVAGSGRYWRAVVYDEYNGARWRSNDRESGALGPQRSLSLPIFEARQIITQTYTFYRDGSLILYAMSNPIGLDRSARVNFNALSGEQVLQAGSPEWLSNGEPWVEEVTYIRSNATVDSSESYQVASWVSQATIEQLQSAGADYPAWVTDRYLPLPNSITARTRQL